MNENEIERLFAAYRDTLGTCGRVSATRRRAKTLPWAFAAMGATILMGSVAFWPTLATAQAFRRVDAALQGVRSMESIRERLTAKGWMTIVRTEYDREHWRIHQYEGLPLEVTSIVANGQVLTDYRRLDHIVLAPLDSGYYGEIVGERNPLQAAEESVAAGHVGAETARSLVPHADVNGRSTYALLLERAEDHYRAEIVVDRGTDLPISTDLTYDGSGGKPDRLRTFYRFGEAIDASAFEPPQGKPIVDIQKAQTELTRRWTLPLATIGETNVWDASVSEDGTVWIAISVPVGTGPFALPTKIETLEAPYVRLRDIDPSGNKAMAQPYRLRGEAVTVVGFVPLRRTRPSVALPTQVAVKFTDRETVYSSEGRPSESPERPIGRAYVLHLRKGGSDRPDYATALDLDEFGLQLPELVWEARAGALERAQRFTDSAKAYERCAAAYRGFLPRLARKPLTKAAQMYEKAGYPADVARIEGELRTFGEDQNVGH